MTVTKENTPWNDFWAQIYLDLTEWYCVIARRRPVQLQVACIAQEKHHPLVLQGRRTLNETLQHYNIFYL